MCAGLQRAGTHALVGVLLLGTKEGWLRAGKGQVAAGAAECERAIARAQRTQGRAGGWGGGEGGG